MAKSVVLAADASPLASLLLSYIPQGSRVTMLRVGVTTINDVGTRVASLARQP
jgi:hypothetical protein